MRYIYVYKILKYIKQKLIFNLYRNDYIKNK